MSKAGATLYVAYSAADYSANKVLQGFRSKADIFEKEKEMVECVPLKSLCPH